MRPQVETQLRRYFDDVEKSHPTLSVDEIMERAEPLQVIPRSQSGRSPNPVMRRWAIVAVTVLLIGLTIVGTFNGDTSPVDEPVATTIPLDPTTAVGTEQDIETGTFSTSLGAFDWWHLAGSGDELPGTGWVVADPGGYLMIDDLGFSETGGTEFWHSVDGREWQLVDSPGISGMVYEVVEIGDQHWVLTDTPAINRSSDGATWVEMPMPVDVPGNYLSLTESGGRILLVDRVNSRVWIESDDAWAELGPIVLPDGKDVPGWVDPGSPVTAGDTTLIPWSFYPESQNGTDHVTSTLTLIRPDATISTVDAPWDVIQGWSAPVVLATGDEFLAFTYGSVDGVPTIEQWASSDGVDWIGPTTPGFFDGNDQVFVFGHGGVVFAQDSGSGAVLVSEDGTTWSDTGVRGWEFIPFGEGGLFGGPDGTFISGDLRNWEPIAEMPGIYETDTWSLSRGRTSVSGETIFTITSINDETIDLWGLRLRD